MIGSRWTGIPSDHIVAELAAFPLGSEKAFELGLTQLSPKVEGPTRNLWRAAEQAMLLAFPGFSIDEAVAIRDQLWFDRPEAGPQTLHGYLTRLARTFLERRGSHATPIPRRSFWRNDGETFRDLPAVARRSWRWISFALPPDLLLVALGTPGSIPLQVEVLSPRLALHLQDSGFAEVHLHEAAGLDFQLLWTGAMVQIAEPSTRAGRFSSPGAAFQEGALLGEWLLRAAIARYVLASYLTLLRTESPGATFSSFFRGCLPRMLGKNTPSWTIPLLDLCLSDFSSGRLPSPSIYPQLQGLYRQLTGVTAHYRKWLNAPDKIESLRDLHRIDPLGAFFSVPGDGGPTPEMSFLAHSLAYLQRCEDERRDDSGFVRIFWQVVRIRSIFYRHIVQRPLIPGLQWFLRHYDRIREARKPLRKGRLVAAARSSGRDKGLRSLEVRTSPDASLTENLETVERLARSAGDWLEESPDHEVGIVFHFSRVRRESSRSGAPAAFEQGTHGDPSRNLDSKKLGSGNPTGYRYASYYRGERQKAIALAGLLERFPRVLWLVRGMDACTDEMGIPTWVLAPLFRYIRRMAEAVSGELVSVCGQAVPPPRMTVHAGEDFPHLLTGLRSLQESVRRFEVRAGDRIGHGIALGLDPVEWARKTGQVPVRREVRLFDLVWAWSWLARNGDSFSGSSKLEREIVRLSEALFGVPVPLHELESLIEDLHDEEKLRRVGFCDGPLPPIAELDGRERRLATYLTDRRIFWQGQVVEWVDPSRESPLLAEIQASIRGELSEQGIAVEVNPSSNLLIGDFTDLTRHPLWRLNPPKSGTGGPPVSVCIGSDDPMTFATCLPEEYQFVFDALLLAGLSDEEALAWVDRARRCGMEHRFTLRLPLDVPRSGLAEWLREVRRQSTDQLIAPPL